jgi:hypothetical protein
VSVFLRAENTQNIIVLVDRLSEVPSFLLIPPVTVRVSKLSLDSRWVRIIAVLRKARMKSIAYPIGHGFLRRKIPCLDY